MSYLLQDGNGWDHTKVVLFQTISRYSEEKYVWRSAYSILVLVRRNIGVLFYFNLTSTAPHIVLNVSLSWTVTLVQHAGKQ